MADISHADLIAKSSRYFGPLVSPEAVRQALASSADPLSLTAARAAVATYQEGLHVAPPADDFDPPSTGGVEGLTRSGGALYAVTPQGLYAGPDAGNGSYVAIGSDSSGGDEPVLEFYNSTSRKATYVQQGDANGVLQILGDRVGIQFGDDGDVSIRRGDGELIVYDNDGTGFYVNSVDGPIDYAAGKHVGIFSDNPSINFKNGADDVSLVLNPASDFQLLSSRGFHFGTGAGPDLDINGNGVNVVDDDDNGFYVSGSGGKTVGMNEGGVQMEGGYLQGVEIADPPAANPNSGRAYFKDVGGKTAFVVRFPTGAVQQVAIEP